MLLAVGAWAVVNRQPITDYVVVHGYHPSSAVGELENEIQFTPKADNLFRATQPEVDDSANFNQHCQKKDADSIVLGCYIDPQHMYIYDVQSTQLNGVKPVTAAHEMLHAAYTRLSSAEQDRVNKMVEAALPTVEQSNTDLAKRLMIYDKTEPGERDNELHSILGTEAQSLPPDLESYYAQYFKNRQLVATFAASYGKVFSNLQSNQTTIAAELKQLGFEIDTLSAEYNTNLQGLNSDIAVFNQKAQTEGSFSSQSEFDAAKATLIVRRKQLDTQRQTINQKVDKYNTERAQLQALNVQVDELNSKLDSTSPTSF